MPKGVYDHKHIKPKVYPTETVETVRRLYESGLTIREVAEEMGSTPKVVYRVMRNHDIPRRSAARRDQTGDRNHMWRGSQARYAALHLRVAAARGKPSLCAWCGETEGRFEWANVSGAYEDVSDYERLCCSCHRFYDAGRRRETGRRTMPEESCA